MQFIIRWRGVNSAVSKEVKTTEAAARDLYNDVCRNVNFVAAVMTTKMPRGAEVIAAEFGTRLYPIEIKGGK